MDVTSSPLWQAQQHLTRGETAQGLAILRRAAASAEDQGQAHALLLQALVAAGERDEALSVLLAASQAPELSADVSDALAFYARELDQHELSNRLYHRAVAISPADPQLWYNLASSERSLGRLSQAAAACQKALDLNPHDFPSLLLRSDVVRATPEANHVAELSRVLDEKASDQAQMFAAYALGKELNDLGRRDEAFAAYANGSRIRRRNLAYDVRQDEAKLARIGQAFDATWFGSARSADAGAGHIFIVGLPRSGTTLVERLLSALPGVRSNGETDNFTTALAQAAPAGGDVFERFAQAAPDQVASAYEALATAPGHLGRTIEKLPLNYLYLGLIARALPRASIVLLRRHPLDSCFAMYRTLFGTAYPFSYDFEDLARYFAAYERLIAHWRALLGERMIEVEYERLVAEPAAVAPDLARRCGLTWTDEALDLSRHQTASNTASAAQVRGEIYKRSAGLWRGYARPLEPLRLRLVELGVAMPDS